MSHAPPPDGMQSPTDPIKLAGMHAQPPSRVGYAAASQFGATIIPSSRGRGARSADQGSQWPVAGGNGNDAVKSLNGGGGSLGFDPHDTAGMIVNIIDTSIAGMPKIGEMVLPGKPKVQTTPEAHPVPAYGDPHAQGFQAPQARQALQALPQGGTVQGFQTPQGQPIAALPAPPRMPTPRPPTMVQGIPQSKRRNIMNNDGVPAFSLGSYDQRQPAGQPQQPPLPPAVAVPQAPAYQPPAHAQPSATALASALPASSPTAMLASPLLKEAAAAAVMPPVEQVIVPVTQPAMVQPPISAAPRDTTLPVAQANQPAQPYQQAIQTDPTQYPVLPQRDGFPPEAPLIQMAPPPPPAMPMMAPPPPPPTHAVPPPPPMAAQQQQQQQQGMVIRVVTPYVNFVMPITSLFRDGIWLVLVNDERVTPASVELPDPTDMTEEGSMQVQVHVNAPGIGFKVLTCQWSGIQIKLPNDPITFTLLGVEDEQDVNDQGQ